MVNPAFPSPPFEENHEAWRAALLACRRVLRATSDDARAWGAALDAYVAVQAGDDPEPVRWEVARAIACASAHQSVRFWRGI